MSSVQKSKGIVYTSFMHTSWSLVSSCFGTIFKFLCFLSHCFSLMFQHQRYPRYYQSNASIAGNEHGPYRSHPSQVKFPNGHLIVGLSPPKVVDYVKLCIRLCQFLFTFESIWLLYRSIYARGIYQRLSERKLHVLQLRKMGE